MHGGDHAAIHLGSAHQAVQTALSHGGRQEGRSVMGRGRGVPYSTRRETQTSGSRDREWLGDVGVKRDSIRIMSYNVLADAYCRQFFKELYFKTPMHLLQWSSRLSLLINEVRSLDPEILSFQEVDRYNDLEAALDEMGYQGVFLQRTGGKPDGCATFFRRSRFFVSDSEQIKMCEVEGNLRDNVALLLRLRRVPLDPQEVTSPDVIVASTHILFNPGRGDVKIRQIRYILQQAALMGGGSLAHLVLLGDFNSAPRSGVYDFILNGSLDIRETDRRRVGGQIEGYNCEHFVSDLRAGGLQQLRYSNYFEQDASDGRDMKRLERQGWNTESLKTALSIDPSTRVSNASDKDLLALFTVTHPFGSNMRSSYYEVTGSEPVFTTSHQAYMGTVDYVMYNSAPVGSSRIVPSAVLSCPDPLRFHSGMPSAKCGSDHISLVVDFEIKQ